MTIKYGREMVLICRRGRKPLLLSRELGLGESFAYIFSSGPGWMASGVLWGTRRACLHLGSTAQ